MPIDKQAFANRVIQGFRDAALHTDAEVGAAGGPSTSFMTNLRKVALGEADMATPRGDTLKRIDRAAEWKTGSARALWLTGAEPEPQRSRLAEVLDDAGTIVHGARRPVVRMRQGGLAGYVEHLEERLLEVEERLDLLEMRLAPADEAPEAIAARRNERRPPRGPQEQHPD